MRITVTVFAGGEGSRIGGNKPLRMLAGLTLLDRAAAQALQWSNRFAVSVRSEAQLGGRGLVPIIDDPDVEGPLGGLISALRFARAEQADAVLTIPADMPFLPPDLGERLKAELAGCEAAIASSGGHLHPVCGLWRTSALDRIAGYLESGRRSLRGFAETIGFRVVEWPDRPIDPFFNINSAQDLADAERLLGG